jgi:hypothetical protein
MKIIIIAVYLFMTVQINSQSVLTLGSGTSMGVLTGSNLCVNIIGGTGILYGGGTICGGFVAIEPASVEIPDKFELSQNYPNPFNPVTNIKIRLPETGMVNLAVFDIAGKFVASLVSGELNAGVYNLGFDASVLSSGTYFYRIEAGEFTDVKKMVLLK